MEVIGVVAYTDGDLWVAQCVEYDIAARADSLPKLPKAFGRALAANLSVNADLGREGFEGIGPAPAHFRTMFDGADIDLTPRTAGTPVSPHFRVAEPA